MRSWLLQKRAADVQETPLQLSLRGTRLAAVSVTNVRMIVDAKAPTDSTTRVSCPSAGTDQLWQTGVSLDEPDPVLRSLSDDNTMGAPYFSDHDVTLSKDEIVGLAVRVFTAKASYTWHVEVDGRAGGHAYTVRVPGEYRTTGASGSYDDEWSWDWSRNPQQLVTGQV